MITDKTAIENYMQVAIDNGFNTQITEWITGVNAEMDKMTDRQLIADASATEYKYDGNGKCSMLIDDFVDIDLIEQDDVDITDDCYQYPANKLPKYKIDSDTPFAKGKQNIVITGKKGYAVTAPADLKFAATVLVAGIINYGSANDGEVKSESIGRYTVTYATDTEKADFDRAMGIIKSYRRIR